MIANEAAWRDFVSEKLAILTPELTPVLRELVQHSHPPEVASLDFEIFSDGFTDGFPVRVFFMDAENSEFFLHVDGKASYPSPVDPDLLKIDHIYAAEEEEAFEDETGELDMWVVASDETIKWLSSCWMTAGGDRLPIRATIGVHDENDMMIELPTRRAL